MMKQLDPGFRALLLEIADRAEAKLGLNDAHIAIVVHDRVETEGGVRFEVGIASDKAPELIAEMRRAFPRRGRPPFRVFVGPFGDLNLVNASEAELRDALLSISGSGPNPPV